MKSKKSKPAKARRAGKDEPTPDYESGDPKSTGRSHGRIIDDQGAPAGKREDDADNTEIDLESGRHGTL
jgi:hypothetical protein